MVATGRLPVPLDTGLDAMTYPLFAGLRQGPAGFRRASGRQGSGFSREGRAREVRPPLRLFPSRGVPAAVEHPATWGAPIQGGYRLEVPRVACVLAGPGSCRG